MTIMNNLKDEITYLKIQINSSYGVSGISDMKGRSLYDELLKKNITPILVGGSGLYIQSVLFDYRFNGQKRTDDQDLTKLANGELWQLLKKFAPEVAEKTDQNNRRRLLRAIEIGQSQDNAFDNQGKNPYYDNFELIGLEMPRELLYARIEERVDQMISSGLVDEVRGLYDKKIVGQSMQAIGYKELYQYFEGKLSFEEAILLIKQQTRRYAKRQMTWFKNQMQAKWFNVDISHFEDVVQEILRKKKKKYGFLRINLLSMEMDIFQSQFLKHRRDDTLF